MLHRIRRAADWFVQQLFPTTAGTPQRPPTTAPFGLAASTPARRTLRFHAPAPHFWTDEGPLLRPYVLSAEEWTRRRRESRARAVICPS